MKTLLKEFKNAANTAYAHVYYDENASLISDVWQGSFGSQDNFKAVLSFVADQVKEKKIKRWVADLRKMEGSFDSSSSWIQTELMPNVIQNGLLHEAVVLPKNIFSKLSAKDTVMKIHNFELRQFEDIEAAEKWILEAKADTKKVGA